MTRPLQVDLPHMSPTGSIRWALAPVREARRLVAAGRNAEVVEWFRQRPYEEVRSTPELAVLFAEALLGAGRLEHADHVSLEAASVARTLGDCRVEAVATAVSGEVALVLGDMPAASSRFSRARSLAAEQSDLALAGECAARIGEIALAGDDPESAVTSFLGAVAAYETVGDVSQALRCVLALALAYRQMARFDDALAAADRAVADAQAAGDPGLRGDALAARADVRLAAGDAGIALREAVQAAALQHSAGKFAHEAEALSLAKRAQVALGAPRRRMSARRDHDCPAQAEITQKCHV